MNSLMGFHKEKKITEHFLNNFTTYVKALIENIRFKTKNTGRTKRPKTSFPKEQVENETCINPFKQSNDYARILRKV